MAKFSVLVAVYNAAETLPRCLDSLCAQTLADFEAICVDDASTDQSWAILSRYAQRDKRFIVRRLDVNRGQAHARNTGLRLASGQYTTFLDSDDALSPDALSSAAAVFEAHPLTGCVLFRVRMCYADATADHDYRIPPFTVKSGREAFIDSLNWTLHGIYAVRTDIHKRYPYDESCHAFSDDNTTRLHYYASREVRRCQGCYFYFQHPGSTTTAIGRSRYDLLTANQSMKRQLLALRVGDDVLDRWENEMWLNVVGLYQFYFQHRRRLSKADNSYGLSVIHDSWQRIETQRIRPRLRRKFGYMPLRGHWLLFRLQEEAYFILRNYLYYKFIKNKT